MNQLLGKAWMEKLRELGCQIEKPDFQNDNIQYHITMPNRSLSEKERDDIFSIILDGPQYSPSLINEKQEIPFFQDISN